MTDKCKTFVARWDHAMCSTCGEEHDRPAPTPTPAPGLDLDAVERAEQAMTPGPWRHGSVERHHVFCSEGDRSLLCPEAGRVLLRMNEHFPHDSDAAGIVTLRNAAPALIAEVRALRAAAEEREADMHARIRAGYDKTVADAWRAEVAKRDAEIADLRALVESQRRDYLDVSLTAELAAARAVVTDVCRYLDCSADQLLAVVTSLYESRARAISDATAARGTVGGLLATARVEASTVGELLTTTPAGAVAEYRRGISSWQARMSGEFAENRFWIERQKRWSKWSVKPIPLTIAARLVIASEADADPSQRGPLPKGG